MLEMLADTIPMLVVPSLRTIEGNQALHGQVSSQHISEELCHIGLSRGKGSTLA